MVVTRIDIQPPLARKGNPPFQIVFTPQPTHSPTYTRKVASTAKWSTAVSVWLTFGPFQIDGPITCLGSESGISVLGKCQITYKFLYKLHICVGLDPTGWIVNLRINFDTSFNSLPIVSCVQVQTFFIQLKWSTEVGWTRDGRQRVTWD